MEDEKKTFTGMKENHIEGRNAVLEAFRSGRTIDKLYVLDGCQDGPVRSGAKRIGLNLYNLCQI